MLTRHAGVTADRTALRAVERYEDLEMQTPQESKEALVFPDPRDALTAAVGRRPASGSLE